MHLIDNAVIKIQQIKSFVFTKKNHKYGIMAVTLPYYF